MFFSRPESGEAAILVHLNLGHDKDYQNLTEFIQLVGSAGADCKLLIQGSRAQPHAKFFAGLGKVTEIKSAVVDYQADVVIFNHSLSPSQERNLELELSCRVVDRTRLILDIFAQRAQTHEGKLQVELAQLEYISTRLIRGWTHLERQKGGIGLRGPGETQLETDRRLLRARIKSINKRLDKVCRQRNQGRRSRQRAALPTVSLVGYTNAGKSSLFNRLTQSQVYAADQLFATLDPTFRRLNVPNFGALVLVDTVGFVRHLPHKLIDAFKGTLQETSEASLLLHLIDAHDDSHLIHKEQVDQVLSEINADEIPVLLVYNKIDLMTSVEPRIDRDQQGIPVRVWLSAETGHGVELLLDAIAELLTDKVFHKRIMIEPQQAELRARLYEFNAVINESLNPKGQWLLEVRLPKYDLLQTLQQVGMVDEHCLNIVD